jgi:acyl-CoA synthetase (AMP-forming)/AMP-acid ligase II
LTGTIILPLSQGLRTVYYPNPNQAAILSRLIKVYRVSILVGTPRFLGNIARAAQTNELKSLRLAVSGAEKCPEWVHQLLEERQPEMKILEGYGVTECSPIISLNPEEKPKAFTIGKPMPSLNYVLIDPEGGGETAKGEMGVLLVRGPTVFEGYLKYQGPPPFVEYKGQRWYYTGDLVKEDDEGFMIFCGRLRRFIKMGGEMVSLPAVEAVLEPHFLSGTEDRPAIAVESTPQPDNPQLVLFTTRETDLDTVNHYINQGGLSSRHHIRKIIRVNEIPVLGTGKADYRFLKSLMPK